MNEILLTELIAKTKLAVTPLRYSQSTLHQYGLAWNDLLQYFEANGVDFFSEDLAKQFVEQSRQQLGTGSLKMWHFRLYRRSIEMLIEVSNTGKYTWQVYRSDPNASMSIKFKTIHNEFQTYLIKTGKGVSTRDLYGTITRHILTYVQNELCITISELTLKDVGKIINSLSLSYQKTSMRTTLSATRVFLKYLWLAQATSTDLTVAVPSSGTRKFAVVPTLTSEEEKQILQSIDRTTRLGKRNYAMILLAIRTGLRNVDIRNLKLTDIDWRNNVINIIQQKNRKPLSLPLLTDVGNAIADYILHARPESDSICIFLKATPPYENISDCYNISYKLLEKTGLRQEKNQFKGFHVFRHSVAARMLSNEVPLSVISNALGHASERSTKSYLSTDGAHLKACALTLECFLQELFPESCK